MLCLCSGLAGVFFELMLKVRWTEIDSCGLYALLALGSRLGSTAS